MRHILPIEGDGDNFQTEAMMARAEAASASARSDSIKGLAQSIAKPAYRRLLTAEPALRRAVPTLIIAFLVTICVGAIVQVLDHRRQAVSGATVDVEAVADIAAGRLERAPEKPDIIQRASDALRLALPTWATAANRKVLLTNSEGKVIAAVPADPAMLGLSLLDILGPSQPLTTFGASAGVLEITAADGNPAFATVRVLKAPYGQLAV